MSFNLEVKEELKNLKMWNNSTQMSQQEQIDRLNAREHFIQSGFLNSPDKKSHLEIQVKSKDIAKELKENLKKYGIDLKQTKRHEQIMLYLKNSDEISNFLAFIGATKAMLRFEDERIIKDTKNNLNRVMNCENANLDKIIKSSMEQIEAIKILEKNGKLATLDGKLQEIAKVRKENPSVSLEELGKLLDNPVGKSGVNYRLKKLVELANKGD